VDTLAGSEHGMTVLGTWRSRALLHSWTQKANIAGYLLTASPMILVSNLCGGGLWCTFRYIVCYNGSAYADVLQLTYCMTFVINEHRERGSSQSKRRLYKAFRDLG
jgi:hypothetical protein